VLVDWIVVPTLKYSDDDSGPRTGFVSELERQRHLFWSIFS
jgi:hypothetical protein